jgi:hypothetical protein
MRAGNPAPVEAGSAHTAREIRVHCVRRLINLDQPSVRPTTRTSRNKTNYRAVVRAPNRRKTQPSCRAQNQLFKRECGRAHVAGIAWRRARPLTACIHGFSWADLGCSGSSGNAIVFSFVAIEPVQSSVSIVVPAVASGSPWTPHGGPWTILVNAKCGKGKTFTVTYAGGNGTKVIAATRAGDSAFTTMARLTFTATRPRLPLPQPRSGFRGRNGAFALRAKELLGAENHQLACTLGHTCP